MTTNLVYRHIGTPITFCETGGDVAITLLNLAAGAGRVSVRYDRGAGDKSVLHLWQGKFQFETAAIVGEGVEIWLFESDGTLADGVIGAIDAELTAGMKYNGKLIGTVYAQTTGTATDFVASGICEIWQQYYSIGVWNGSTGDNLENTANVNKVIITPLAMDIQESA